MIYDACAMTKRMPDELLSLTLKEMNALVKAYGNMEKENRKRQSYNDYKLANLIGISVGRLFSKDATYPQFYEYYSEYYTDEEREKLEEERQNESIFNAWVQLATEVNRQRSDEDNV